MVQDVVALGLSVSKLFTGDTLYSINGQSCDTLDHASILKIVSQALILELRVVRVPPTLSRGGTVAFNARSRKNDTLSSSQSKIVTVHKDMRKKSYGIELGSTGTYERSSFI